MCNIWLKLHSVARSADSCLLSVHGAQTSTPVDDKTNRRTGRMRASFPGPLTVVKGNKVYEGPSAQRNLLSPHKVAVVYADRTSLLSALFSVTFPPTIVLALAQTVPQPVHLLFCCFCLYVFLGGVAPSCSRYDHRPALPRRRGCGCPVAEGIHSGCLVVSCRNSITYPLLTASCTHGRRTFQWEPHSLRNH
ncbi:unnamed protein product [Ectocarpus fasciculatus]